jgi:hypothetical protein
MANAVVIEEWVKALESGEYGQTMGVLRRVDGDAGFCCLGVLCDLAVKHDIIPEPVPDTDPDSDYEYPFLRYGASGDQSTGALPSAVIEWAGLPDSDPQVTAAVDSYGPDRFELSRLNDTFGWGFNQIAEAIRAEYLTKDEQATASDAG